MPITPAQIDALEPGNNSDVAVALMFLRLVVRNNPNKTAAEIAARPDVQSALATLDEWFTTASVAITEVIEQSPITPAGNAADAAAASLTDMLGTIAKMRGETALTDQNVDYWHSQDISQEQAWSAKMQLRMSWFTKFLAGLLGIDTPANARTKTWNAHLDTVTCSYCGHLHGVTIPVTDSFLGHVLATGWTRPYGNLYGPPLHPSCRCWLTFSF